MSDAEGVMESPDSSAEQSSSSGPAGELTIALPEGGAEEEPKTPLKRGRGRPRKYPKEPDTGEPKIKRPRGRPKGSLNKNRKPTPEPTEKKPRGRPKGSFGRKKKMQLIGYKGRGRPKGSGKKTTATPVVSETEWSPVKRGRGRPKGSPNKKKATPETPSPSKSPSPSKRSRGRPRKIVPEEETSWIEEKSVEETTEEEKM